MGKAYLYIRFSTLDQAMGDSERRQFHAGEAWASKHGMELSLIKDLGVSAFHGTHINKGALGKFRREVEDGVITPGSTLLVESLDRFSRETEGKALRLLMDLTDAGITIVDLGQNKSYSGEMELPDLMMALVTSHRAHQESKVKSTRVAAAWANKRANPTKPLTSRVPYGYRVIDGKITIVKEQAAAVRDVFKWAAAGTSVHGVVRKLNQSGHKPLRGGIWQKSTTLKILANRSYIGEYQPHTGSTNRKTRKPCGDPIKDYFPRIIKDDHFDKVQQRLIPTAAPVPHRGGVSNLLTGLAKCAKCDGSMIYIHKGKRASWPQLVCSHAKAGKCKYRAVPLPTAEFTVINALLSAGDLHALIPKKKGNDELERAERRLAAADKSYKDARKKYDNYAEALLSLGAAAASSPLVAKVNEAQLTVGHTALMLQQAKQDVAKLRGTNMEEMNVAHIELTGLAKHLVTGEMVFSDVWENIGKANLHLWENYDDYRLAVKGKLQVLVEYIRIDPETLTWSMQLKNGGVLSGELSDAPEYYFKKPVPMAPASQYDRLPTIKRIT